MTTPPDLAIRPATVADAECLAQLSEQLGYPSTTTDAARRLGEINGQGDHAVFVADRGGQLLGWIHVFVAYSLLADRPAEIAGLVVDEGQRGRGLGRLLMDYAEQWAWQKGCGSVRLRSNVVRSRAHAFYEQLGYRVIKSQKAFCKDLV